MVLTGAAGIKTKLTGTALLKQKAYKAAKKALITLKQDELLKKLQDINF